MLNNREIATITWISLFFLVAFFKRELRSSFRQFLGILFSRFVIILIGSMLAYVFLMVLTFRQIGFWDASAIKDTVVWIFGVAFVMLLNANKAGDDERYFRRIISDSIKLAVILEFIANMYTFSLSIELTIVPVITFLILLKTVAGLKPENKQVDNFIGYILGVIGTVLIVVTLYDVFVDLQGFATLRNLRDFLLPPVFTFALLPFIYGMALFMMYESLFNRIDYVNPESCTAMNKKR
jgi:hypothetical protein